MPNKYTLLSSFEFFFILFLFLITSPLYSFEIITEEDQYTHSLILESIDLIHKNEYKEALKNLKKVQNLRPDRPEGYFYQGVTMEWMMLDFKVFKYEKKFLHLMDKTIEIARKMYATNELDPWANFYLGAAYGFKGIYLIKYGNWIDAFYNGIKGVKYFKIAVELKPDLYDVYYGLGQYYYWRSDKAKILWWLNIKDEKAKGFEYLNLAVEKGRYTRLEAFVCQVKLYFNEKDYEKSIQIAEESLIEYPHYIYSHWYLCYCYIELKKWDKALESVNTIEEILDMHSISGLLAYIEIYHFKSIIYMEMKDYALAAQYAQKIISYPESRTKDLPFFDDYKEKAEDTLIKIKDLLPSALK